MLPYLKKKNSSSSSTFVVGLLRDRGVVQFSLRCSAADPGLDRSSGMVWKFCRWEDPAGDRSVPAGEPPTPHLQISSSFLRGFVEFEISIQEIAK